PAVLQGHRPVLAVDHELVEPRSLDVLALDQHVQARAARRQPAAVAGKVDEAPRLVLHLADGGALTEPRGPAKVDGEGGRRRGQRDAKGEQSHQVCLPADGSGPETSPFDAELLRRLSCCTLRDVLMPTD